MTLVNKTDVLSKTLQEYFQKSCNMKILYSYLEGKDKVSLRIFDFLCTKYVKQSNVIYYLNQGNKRIPFNLGVAYKTQLKAYSKLQFDPFKRHDRIVIPCSLSSDNKLTTTVGQMNFFKFAIDNKLIDWIEKKENRQKIEKAIHDDISKKGKKTKTLISSTSNYKITVTFK